MKLPQEEPSDDFKAGWDAALGVAAHLVRPPGDKSSLVNTCLHHAADAALSLRGKYQFRHTKAATE